MEPGILVPDGLPDGASGKELACHTGDIHGSDPPVWKILLEEGMAAYSTVLGESHGQRCLTGSGP